MPTVRVALRGGPENGSEITIPTDSTGLPTARYTFPARIPEGTRPRPGQLPPLLVYERLDQRTDGVWRYHFVGAETQHTT